MSQENKIGALWLNTSAKGEKYMSGVIDGRRIVVFKNGFKEEDKHPDYVVYVSEDRQGGENQRKPTGNPTNNKTHSKFKNAKRKPSNDAADDDIPF